MNCPKCGSESGEGAAFCTNCGTRIESEQVVAVPQPPSVDAIPEPNQIPDIPAQPEMPENQAPEPPPVQEQAPEAPPAPEAPAPEAPPEPPPAPEAQVQEQAPDAQYGYAPPPPDASQPYGVSPPYGAPPDPNAPPPYGVSPQQPYYQQPGAAYPPQPGYPPVSPPKKSKTGLIIGLAAGAVAFLAIVVTAVILLSRFMGGGSSEAEDLFGTWEYDSGNFVYFFGRSHTIMFFEEENGTYGVFEAEHGEWGTWYVNRDSKLIVDGDWIGRNEFTFNVRGSRLTITDADGDSIHYNKVSDRANPPGRPIMNVIEPPPTPEPPPDPPSPPPDTPEPPETPEPPDPTPAVVPFEFFDELVGEWKRESGDYLYFFGRSATITFTDNGDGTYGIEESDYGETGKFFVDGNGGMSIDGDWTGRYEFTYTIEGNRLTLSDSDNDSAVYIRS